MKATEQILAYLDVPTLRELAAILEVRDPAMVARRSLTSEGVERLAEILLRGGKPTVGFWIRNRPDVTA